jgi:hypothetical protein
LLFSSDIVRINRKGAIRDRMRKKPPNVGAKTPGTGSNPLAYRAFPIAVTLAFEYKSTAEKKL